MEKINQLMEDFKEALSKKTEYIRLKNAELCSIAVAIEIEVEKAKENGVFSLTPEQEKEIEAVLKYTCL